MFGLPLLALTQLETPHGELALACGGGEGIERGPASFVLEANAVLELHGLTTMSFDMPTGRNAGHQLRLVLDGPRGASKCLFERFLRAATQCALAASAF